MLHVIFERQITFEFKNNSLCFRGVKVYCFHICVFSLILKRCQKVELSFLVITGYNLVHVYSSLLMW